MPSVFVAQPNYTAYSSTTSKTHQITWTTGAGIRLLESFQESSRTGRLNPFTYEHIANWLRLSSYEVAFPKPAMPYLTLFLCKSGGVVYEVYANLLPASSPDALPRCEVVSFGVCTNPELLTKV